MDHGLKEKADAGQFSALHIDFCYALSIDPSFEDYKEEYAYCKTKPGFFEAHIELTPLSFDKAQWNKSYRDKILDDLGDNFSQKRYEHLIEVGKVIFAPAPKVSNSPAVNNPATIETQPKQMSGTTPNPQTQAVATPQRRNITGLDTYGTHKTSTSNTYTRTTGTYSTPQNRQFTEPSESHDTSREEPKKALGIVLGILAVVAIVVIVAVLLNR